MSVDAALDMQSPPAFQAARRDLKLRAMKAAIEARQTVSTTNADIERLLAEAIAQTQWDAGSNERLTAIIAAIRAKPLR